MFEQRKTKLYSEWWMRYKEMPDAFLVVYRPVVYCLTIMCRDKIPNNQKLSDRRAAESQILNMN